MRYSYNMIIPTLRETIYVDSGDKKDRVNFNVLVFLPRFSVQFQLEDNYMSY